MLISARNRQAGEGAVRKLSEESDVSGPRFHQLDVCDPASIQALADHLNHTYQGLDILVNNAGVMVKSSSSEPLADQVQTTLAVNFWGCLNCCRVLFPYLRPGARVVNVSSVYCRSTLRECSPALKSQLTAPDLTMARLESLMTQYQHQVRRFLRAGVLGSQVRRFLRAGVRGKAGAEVPVCGAGQVWRFLRAGVRGSHVRRFLRAGVRGSQVRRFLRAGVRGSQVRRFLRAGVRGSQVRRFLRAGVRGSQVRRCARQGRCQVNGWSTFAYGVSKIGVTLMTAIQQRQMDRRVGNPDILINSCCPGWCRTDLGETGRPSLLHKVRDRDRALGGLGFRGVGFI
ncbi:hypothetical protein ACOMHN_029851 [Nucella lapillus]